MHIFSNHNADPTTEGNEMNDNETPWAMLKLAFAWLLYSLAKLADKLSDVSLANWIQIVVLLLTLAQLFFLMRDKWWRDRKKRAYQRSKTRAMHAQPDTDTASLE